MTEAAGSARSILEVRGLRKAYRGRHVVDDVAVTVAAVTASVPTSLMLAANRPRSKSL